MEDLLTTARRRVFKYKHFKYSIFITFNVVLFYLLYIWVLKNVQMYDLMRDIELVAPITLASTFLLGSFNLGLYALRLSIILNISFRQAFGITCVGYGVNNIAPFRLGEFYRIYYANQQYALSNARVIAGSVVERYFDFLMILILGALMIMVEPKAVSHRIVYVFAGLVVCAVLSLLLYYWLSRRDGRAIEKLSHISMLKSFFDALKNIFSTSQKMPIVLLSVFVWVVLLTLYYIYFHFNLLGYPFGLGGALFLCFATTILFAIPYTFAGLGAFESATLFYLIKFLNIGSSKALAIALVFHFALALPQIIWMLLVYVFDKLGQLRR